MNLLIKQYPRLLFAAALLLSVSTADAAEWQWSVPVTSVTSGEINGEHPRAFLYIPPDCQRVRAVIVGQHNMLEEGILEHPILRRAMADTGMAAVWVSPAFNGLFRYDQGAGEQFDGIMNALAEQSGYQELAFAPAVPIGHSAMAGFPYNFAAWNPGRTLGAISCKGGSPDAPHTPGFALDFHRLDGVPLLQISGEYEDAQERAGQAAAFRGKYPQCPLSMLADEGGGHFDFHDKLVAYIGLYLRKLAQYRLHPTAPLDKPVPLNWIDPTSTGWIADRWRLNAHPKAPPAPVGKYTGPEKESLWYFDEEHARATETYNAGEHMKKPQLLGYLQNGKVLDQDPKLHAQVNLNFEPAGDGMTFKLTGCFIDSVPLGRPVSWSGLPAGSQIGHASGGGPVIIRRICGPVEQLSSDTFAIRFYRMGMNNTKRSNDLWFMAIHPGDTEYKRAVQQSQMRFPLTNVVGEDQKIDFPEIPAQRAGTSMIRLNAGSSASNANVHYYVREGPAEVEGNTLRFTRIPPRSKFPIPVTVVAWQWGRSIEPRLKSATPVVQTFILTK